MQNCLLHNIFVIMGFILFFLYLYIFLKIIFSILLEKREGGGGFRWDALFLVGCMCETEKKRGLSGESWEFDWFSFSLVAR
jgi:hypothetical protein